MNNKIKSPRMEVLLEQPGSDDLLEVIIQSDNRDMVRYDRARAQRRWPASTDAPFMWMTFLAWAALIRTGHDLAGPTFEDFEGRCVQISAVDKDGNPVDPADAGGDPVDPTPAGAAPA